jgi:peptide/nickel transport system substrate-binding protein
VSNYTIDSTGTIYTFTLKDSIYFHQDECFKNEDGRLLLSDDVLFCIQNLFTNINGNVGYKALIDIVKGSREYFEKSNTPDELGHIEGLKKIDDKEFQIELTHPNSQFLQILAMPELFVYAPEAYLKYGTDFMNHAVGTGAYILRKNDGREMLFVRNPEYHGKDTFGNNLPFLDKINVSFNRDKKDEFVDFTEGKLEMLYRIPREYLSDVLKDSYQNIGGKYDRYILQRNPEMMTQFLGFNNSRVPFNDINLRKAISFAIDREHIIDHVLKGEGFKPGIFGITAPGFENYPIDSIKGYDYNPDSARYYFQISAYSQSDDKSPITLWLNSDGNRNTHVCVEVKKQLNDILGIDVQLEIVPLSILQEKIFDGSAGFYRIGWLADRPSPENFLRLFYSGKSSPDDESLNFFQYHNDVYDDLFARALMQTKTKDSYEVLLQAEKAAMNEAPLVVLWYDEGFRLLQPFVRNFPNNPMQYRIFNEVYFEIPETLEQQSL